MPVLRTFLGKQKQAVQCWQEICEPSMAVIIRACRLTNPRANNYH